MVHSTRDPKGLIAVLYRQQNEQLQADVHHAPTPFAFRSPPFVPPNFPSRGVSFFQTPTTHHHPSEHHGHTYR